MKKIEHPKALPVGTKIVNINGDRMNYYEYLGVHPHNEQYVLLLDTLTQDATKFYIPNIENSDKWQIDFTSKDLLKCKYNYYIERANKILNQMELLEKEGGLR